MCCAGPTNGAVDVRVLKRLARRLCARPACIMRAKSRLSSLDRRWRSVAFKVLPMVYELFLQLKFAH